MHVTIEKSKLLAKLKENREEHKRIYEQALVNWEKAVKQNILAVIYEFNAKKHLNLSKITQLSKPVSYVTEYDDAIQLVEWTESDTITLEQREFNQYVLDKWQWMRNFAANSTAYLDEFSNKSLQSKLV